MNFSISTYIPGSRPKVLLPNRGILTYLGEEGIRKVVSDHYDLLGKSEISDLFPKHKEVFEKAKLKSSDFFIQIMGGHNYYKENQGPPMMTKRHAPFKITPEARIIWLKCYQQVLDKLELPEDLKQSYWDYLDKFSMWMVNTIDEIKHKEFQINF